MARYIAKNIVAAGLADRCEVQLAYAIGVADPVSVLVETFGTDKVEAKIPGSDSRQFQTQPQGHHRDSESAPADLSQDGSLWPLRSQRSRISPGKQPTRPPNWPPTLASSRSRPEPEVESKVRRRCRQKNPAIRLRFLTLITQAKHVSETEIQGGVSIDNLIGFRVTGEKWLRHGQLASELKDLNWPIWARNASSGPTSR